MELRDVMLDALTKPTKGGKVPIVEVECGPWTAADLAQHLAAAIYPKVDVPTEAGDYWWWNGLQKKWRTVGVEWRMHFGVNILTDDNGIFVGPGEWRGPLPTPGGE